MDIIALQTFVSTTLIDVLLEVLAALAFWIVGRAGSASMQAAMARDHVDPTLTHARVMPA
jgi:hypothetical protein